MSEYQKVLIIIDQAAAEHPALERPLRHPAAAIV